MQEAKLGHKEESNGFGGGGSQSACFHSFSGEMDTFVTKGLLSSSRKYSRNRELGMEVSAELEDAIRKWEGGRTKNTCTHTHTSSVPLPPFLPSSPNKKALHRRMRSSRVCLLAAGKYPARRISIAPMMECTDKHYRHKKLWFYFFFDLNSSLCSLKSIYLSIYRFRFMMRRMTSHTTLYTEMVSTTAILAAINTSNSTKLNHLLAFSYDGTPPQADKKQRLHLTSLSEFVHHNATPQSIQWRFNLEEVIPTIWPSVPKLVLPLTNSCMCSWQAPFGSKCCFFFFCQERTLGMMRSTWMWDVPVRASRKAALALS